MSLARVNIEQTGRTSWISEVEAGFPTCRRERVLADNFDDLLLLVAATHARLTDTPSRLGEMANEIVALGAEADQLRRMMSRLGEMAAENERLRRTITENMGETVLPTPETAAADVEKAAEQYLAATRPPPAAKARRGRPPKRR